MSRVEFNLRSEKEPNNREPGGCYVDKAKAGDKKHVGE
jgi:hypothetical protein